MADYGEGVDLTLIRYALSLTREERLPVMQDSVNSIEAIRQENALV